MKAMPWTYLVLFIIFSFFNSITLAHSLENDKFTVQILYGDNEDTTATVIKSAVNREIRRLGDVKIVDTDKPDWIIQIITLEIKNNHGSTGLIVYSVVVTKPFDNKQLIPLTKSKIEPKTPVGKILGYDPDQLPFPISDPVKYVQSSTKSLESIIDHHIIVDHKSKIQETIRYIIARFEINQIEPGRKTKQMVNESVRKLLDQYNKQKKP